MTDKTEVLPGQVWSMMDRRYDGWRYPRVLEVQGDSVLVQHRNGRRSHIIASRFGAKNRAGLSLCGSDGPGVLPALEKPKIMGCLRAGIAPVGLALEAILAVGFGFVNVTRDGVPIWCGDDEDMTLHQFENQATREPGDWRVRFEGPMSERLYQRHGDGLWVLVFQGHGFA